MVETFNDRQLRVLGALAEKAAMVPDTYPMTLRGLQSACNQRTSRDPVTDYDEYTLQVTLDELKALGVVRFVYASHGARTTKYRHVLDERLGLDAGELALVTALMLRGPQTVNELRTRTERAHSFADNEEVSAVLQELADRDEPLVALLARQPGQKESRWMHLLGESAPDDEVVDDEGVEDDAERPSGDVSMDPRSATSTPGVPTVGTRSAGLEARVAELEERVAALEGLLTDPQRSAGGSEGAAPAGPDEENP